MIEIVKELDVEVSKPNIFQALVAKQYDMNTRFLKVTLKDSGTRIDIPNIETAKVVINADRKDGQSNAFYGVINDDGTVTVPLHSWMLELDGTVICDISVIDTASDNNKKLTTTSFTLIVEKAAYGGEDVTNDPQYDVLVELLGTCANAKDTAEEALNKSNEALEISAEANSKYEACVEATENANAVREEIEAGGYIESLKEVNNGGKFKFWVGTQQEYNRIADKDSNTLYVITNSGTEQQLLAAINVLYPPSDKITVSNFIKGKAYIERYSETLNAGEKKSIYYSYHDNYCEYIEGCYRPLTENERFVCPQPLGSDITVNFRYYEPSEDPEKAFSYYLEITNNTQEKVRVDLKLWCYEY